jgi:hypothetical protein
MENLKNIVDIFSFMVASLALALSAYNYMMLRRDTLYKDIDGLYMEVLKLAINNPRFINPDLTCDYKKKFKDDELHKYHAYAYLTWNVCETIADRHEDEDLFNTWKPVILAEDKLHGTWLDDPGNQHRFKESFIKFIKDLRAAEKKQKKSK